mgnify:CR=1 FL=1
MGHTIRRLAAAGVTALALGAGCGDPAVKQGALQAGVAEAPLDIPVGTPLAGYTFRMLGISRPDRRDSPFAPVFPPSAGVHTPPSAKVIWLHNDDHHLVLVKIDVCYIADHVVEDVEDALSEQLDQDLHGQVMIAASHTHQGYGAWDAHLTYFLGGDQHHPEVDARLVHTITETAVAAWESREPAAIGMGWAVDWDPDDRVYRDRRGENNDLAMWGTPGELTGKDPHLHVARIDRADGTPLAMTVTFGIHGIAVGEDSPMASTEASGQIEQALEEQFERPVLVMHLQGSGGDASPAGRGARFEKLEDAGRSAVGPIMALYDSIETAQADLAIETSAAREPQSLDAIRVSRDGAVDFRYDPTKRPDGVVYNEDGSIRSPLEEYNPVNGSAFCGSESPQLPGRVVSVDTFPYTSCVVVDDMLGLIDGTFPAATGHAVAPIPASTTARTAAVRLGPLPVRDVDGTVHNETISAAFFPGEPTAIYGEQFRRRAAQTWGDRRAWMVGYAQDHEGYLLVPEDWLVGGYEPNINLWGPLQGEYLMERVLDRGVLELGDGAHQPWEPETPAPIAIDRRRAVDGVPERTPSAGTRITEVPEEPPLWTPDDVPVALETPSRVPRVQGLVQLAWQGGDPRVDRPVVTLEHQVDGEWTAVLTRSGRPLTDRHADILLAWTPDPLKTEDAPDGDRNHRWWAEWQAVSHWHDPAGLPEGNYRLVARGQHFTGDETAWPWSTTPYEVTGDAFVVEPASLAVVEVEGGVEVWLPGPEHGFRQIAQGGAAAGENPVETLDFIEVDGAVVPVTPEVRGARLFVPLDLGDANTVRVGDTYGNVGSLDRSD